MPASETRVRNLDLAARAVDLTLALMKATSSQDSLFRGAWEIGQWLGRERLNQYELQDCMQKAKGLVVPNYNGQKWCDDIIEGVESKPVGPLFLQQSGSLGRLMAQDPYLCWMISTVACLFQFHRNDRFVAETLSAFIMRAQSARQSINATGIPDGLLYNPAQIQIRPVIAKIVSSVWYNVINAGCDTIPLPSELLSVCHEGHYLDPDDFSIVAHTLYSRCTSKAILRSDHLLRDIMLWLLLHYDGLLVVNVGGKIIYEKHFGNPKRELEVHVKSICLDGETCKEGRGEKYEILQDVAGKFEHFLSGYSFTSSDIPPQPGIRQELYEISRRYPRESAMWNKGIQTLVKCTAQQIMRWLLNVRVVPQEDFSELGFSAVLDSNLVSDPGYRICNILKRVPAMINSNWGNTPPSQLIFAAIPTHDRPDEVLEQSGRSRYLEGNIAMYELEEVLPYFPILQDLLRKISPDCYCNHCQNPDDGQDRLQSGCLRRVALEEVMLLLAHGIADGFNVSDVSAIADLNPISKGVTVILLELCKGKKVCWDSWFGLAASLYLGCPFEQPPAPDHPAFGGTAFAAIQYGNLAAQAPWLDLSNKLEVSGCFGLIGARGRLGVITKSSNHDAMQFRSVEETFAIIETEGTEDTSIFNSRFKKEPIAPGSTFAFEDDRSQIESDVILISVHEKFYRLLLRIKTPSHWRVIDPSDAMNGVIRRIPFNSCLHESKSSENAFNQTKFYTLEEVVGRWPDTIQSSSSTPTSDRDPSVQDGTFHITQVLDTNFKQNIALALSICVTAIQNHPSSSCFSCTFNYARIMTRKPLRQGEGGNVMNRYIINLKPYLGEKDGKFTKRLIKPADSGDSILVPVSSKK